MATWPELEDFACRTFGGVRREDGALVMWWRSSEDNRAGEQRIALVALEMDQPCVAVVAELFPERYLAFRDALVFNAALAAGALLLHGERYCLRCVLPLACMTWEELRRAVEYLAREATRLRLWALPRPQAATLHGAYAD